MYGDASDSFALRKKKTASSGIQDKLLDTVIYWHLYSDFPFINIIIVTFLILAKTFLILKFPVSLTNIQGLNSRVSTDRNEYLSSVLQHNFS